MDLLVVLAVMAVGTLATVIVLGAVRVSVAVGLLLARTFSDVGASSGGSLLPSSILAALLSLAMVVVAALPDRERLSPRLVAGFVGAGVGVLGSVLVFWRNFDFSLGPLQEGLRLASYLAVFAIAYRSGKRDPSTLRRYVLVLTIVPALFVVGTFAVGWGSTINAAGRAMGGFSHANTAAAYFGVALVLSLGLYWEKRSRGVAIAVVACALALFLTQSLGTLVGAAVGASFVLIHNSSIRTGRKIALGLASGAAGFLLFRVLGVSDRLSELDGLDLEAAVQTGTSANSLEWRIINWQRLLEEWWSGPRWLGYGLGSTSSTVMPLGTSPHSLPVQIAVETGIVGLGVVLIALAVVANALSARRKVNRAAVATLVGLGAFAMVSGSSSNLLGYTAAGFLGCFALGCILGATRGTHMGEQRLSEERERSLV